MVIPRRPRSRGPSWVCMLPGIGPGQTAPDEVGLGQAEQLLGRRAVRTARHACGRLWLAGDPGTQDWRVVAAGSVRVALFGHCPLPDSALRGRVERAVACGTIDALTRLPGDFLLLVSSPDAVHGYTDPAGLRRLFHTRHHDQVLISDRAALLAELTGAAIDTRWLAARLACPELVSAAAATAAPYTAIHTVPPGHRITLDRTPATRTPVTVAGYWTPPGSDGHIDFGEAAGRLADALTGAVTDATTHTTTGPTGIGAGMVSCQLSGGLDSAALAGLAAQQPGRPMLLVTAASVTAANDDVFWARRVAANLPGAGCRIRHRVLEPGEHPAFFAPADPGLPLLDEPAPFAASAARICHLAQVVTASGARVHLNGQGGDEVLTAPVGYLRDHLRQAPRDALRRVRGHAALSGVAARHLLAAMTTNPSYRSWLAGLAAGDLTYRPGRRDRDRVGEMAGWEAPVLLPPWATGDAEAMLREQLRGAAAQAVPLAATASRHYELVRVRAMARRAGLYRDALEALGVTARFPFFDRAVLHACLAVHPAQRTDPWQPKPLLHAALGPALGPVLPDRRTKGHYNHDILHGLATHREALLEMFDGSALAGLGLIDDTRIRRAIGDAEHGRIPPSFLNETLACETWLKAHHHTTTQSTSGAA
ncbi:asparagine synthase-related protein [Actinomadura violacea]|uniref:asparagine synthase (glutamine-hydrolyzing) n=1 Tax=Actinomadura violacea TaxID=2819934 RepID=A0ABS3S9T5_9ACTN|nr:asparagine synthase-related protein [Actinomadura violacea]MBO2464980.1 hypothetical protein [Actinomadura violacea]